MEFQITNSKTYIIDQEENISINYLSKNIHRSSPPILYCIKCVPYNLFYLLIILEWELYYLFDFLLYNIFYEFHIST